jgi:hypothetical protein
MLLVCCCYVFLIFERLDDSQKRILEDRKRVRVENSSMILVDVDVAE